MTQPLEVLVAEAFSTGRISHLPDGHFIDGRFQPSQSGARMDSWDPGRGGVFASLAAGKAVDLDQAVRAARRTQASVWCDLKPAVGREKGLDGLRNHCRTKNVAAPIARSSEQIADHRKAIHRRRRHQACQQAQTGAPGFPNHAHSVGSLCRGHFECPVRDVPMRKQLVAEPFSSPLDLRHGRDLEGHSARAAE